MFSQQKQKPLILAIYRFTEQIEGNTFGMKVENFCQILLNSTDKKQYAWNKNVKFSPKRPTADAAAFIRQPRDTTEEGRSLSH